MPDDQNTDVTPQGDDVTPNENQGVPADGGDTSEESTQNLESHSIPYPRFKEVIDQNNDLKGKVEELEGFVNEVRQNMNPQSQEQTADEWTQKAQSAKGWGEFVSAIQEDTFRKWEEREAKANKEAEEKLQKEIGELYDNGVVKTRDEENKLIKFALDKGKELGTNLPLRVAAELMKATEPDTSGEREDVSKKVQSPKRSSGVSNDQTDYKEISSKSLDEVIHEAKENAPKE